MLSIELRRYGDDGGRHEVGRRVTLEQRLDDEYVHSLGLGLALERLKARFLRFERTRRRSL